MNILDNYKKLYLVRKIFEKYDINLIALYGTLIGICRDKKPIPYDNGHDMAIISEDFVKLFQEKNNLTKCWNLTINNNIKKDLENKNFNISYRNGILRLRLEGKDNRDGHIDIFLLHKLKNKYYECYYNLCLFSDIFFDEIIESKYLPGWNDKSSFLIPKYYDKFLEGIYTDKEKNQDWRIPSGCKKAENSSCSPHCVIMDSKFNMRSKKVYQFTKKEKIICDEEIYNLRIKKGKYDKNLVNILDNFF